MGFLVKNLYQLFGAICKKKDMNVVLIIGGLSWIDWAGGVFFGCIEHFSINSS
jgi:hypothetical protein